MTKAPDTQDDKPDAKAGSELPPPASEPTAVTGRFDWEDEPTPVAPGPDEAPPTLPSSQAPPDPVQFPIPELIKLSPGQIGGLGKEALEAYLFGQRTRYDAAGRFWDMRREPVGDQWMLTIRVSLGGSLLLQAGMPLDRLPSAEGEHALFDLVESMVDQANAAQIGLRAEQQSQIKQAEKDAKRDDAEAKEQAKDEVKAAHERSEVGEHAAAIKQEKAEAEREKLAATPVEKGWKK